MNIAVIVKQVPDTETQIKISPDGTSIIQDGVKFVVNPYDEFALEEAVRIKEKVGGEVTVISLGPERAKEAIRTCLAVGADKAVHIWDESFANIDGMAAAKILAAKISTLQYDLILCGKQAVDDDMAYIGPALAALLRLPFVSVITKLNLSDDQKSATVHREIEGATEIIETELPAIFAAQKGLNEPRYASLQGMMKAKKKEIETVNAAALGFTPEQITALIKTKIIRLSLPPPRPVGRVISGTPEEAVQTVVRLLREEAKVI